MSAQLFDDRGRVVGHAENTDGGVRLVVSEGVDVEVETVEADR